MRTHLSVLLTAVAMFAVCINRGSVTYAQTPNRGLEGKDQYRFAITVVRAVLAEPTGFHSTFVENPIGRLGDSASVAIIRLVNAQQLSDRAQVTELIFIIRAAFARPCIIDLEIDKKPNATLLLLRSLEGQTRDEKLKYQIEEATTFVQLAASQKCPVSQD